MDEIKKWTVKMLLDWISEYLADKGVDSPRLSGELLLCHILSCHRIELYTGFDRVVDRTRLNDLHKLVKRCAQHEPVAHLVGRCEFYSLPIKVSKHCLIPRPETELLVELAIDFLRSLTPQHLINHPRAHVLDLCTGSGCIAVAVAKNFTDCDIVATDIAMAVPAGSTRCMVGTIPGMAGCAISLHREAIIVAAQTCVHGVRRTVPVYIGIGDKRARRNGVAR